MGVYNPHAPEIIGQEWVPIQNENTIFAPVINSVELGHEFVLGAAQQIRDARFYLNEFPPAYSYNQVMYGAIYAEGTEDQTGPISSVIIPCNNGGTTGIGSTAGVAQALLNPDDNDWLIWGSGVDAADRAKLFFAVNQYSQLLNGKRILAVDLLYAFADNASTNFADIAAARFVPRIENDAGNRVDFLALEASSAASTQQIFVRRLGDVNHFWSPSLSPNSTVDRMPWRYVDLQRFEASAANRIGITIGPAFTVAAVTTTLNYAALRVTYCEEKRILVGGRAFGDNFNAPAQSLAWQYGVNIVPLRGVNDHAADQILPSGSYSVVLSSADIGDLTADLGEAEPFHLAGSTYPSLNALRELYQIPSHPGVQVDIPFLPPDHLGETFTAIETHILPQLSLHVTGGDPLKEVHVYGRQAVAQVYGSITATQEIQDGLAGGSASWPWVRYMARRFGDTVVPLTLTGVGQSVVLTVDEFDDLPEILDGWKEITLRFDTPPVMGSGTNPQFVWSSAGETAGNRWEILGACAPALSGLPGNLLNLAPPSQQLSIATYGQPVSGAQINLGWMPQGVGSPPVSGTTDDQTSDAFLIFAQDMPAVSGFAVTTLSQAITGIGQNCGVDPCCIPTDILYNRITWTPFGISDNFDVDGVNGWPPTDTGETWTILFGPTADFYVTGGSGVMKQSTAGLFTHIGLSGTRTDSEALITFTSPTVPTGDTFGFVINMRVVVDYIRAQVTLTTSNTVIVDLIQASSGLLASTVTVPGVTTTTPLKMRMQAYGSIVRAKVWAASEDEPTGWTISGITTHLAAGQTTLVWGLAAGVTNPLPLVFTVDDFSSTPFVNGNLGYLELQRMDTVETDWHTIMKSTSDNIPTGFNDYEARVGIETSYRIRAVNVYDFPGPWSDTISLTMPAPGVSGGCLEGGHVLIFTSNEHQDGAINLAYSSVWMDEQVEENFNFPEASFVQLQLMYNKDFYTAFRPLERGGERFSRTLLVQAAAIAPETLGDFTSLRDMAWDTVNYICVRDEDGNRWLATVLVPGGRVLRDRRLYLAPVEIIEVTTTPTPVNP